MKLYFRAHWQLGTVPTYLLVLQTIMSTLQFTHSNQIDPLRRQCSLQTLQQEQGHFQRIVEHLRKSTGNYVNVLLQMSQCKNDYDRIALASGVEGMVIFTPAPVFKPKSDAEAHEARLKGNALYKKGQDQKAYYAYSVAVIKSVYPDHDDSSSTMLAYSLANRSACLVRMEMYKEAIDDIQLALSLNYPKEDRHKLYERLGKAYLAIGETGKARAAFGIVKELTQNEEKFSLLMNSVASQK